jgi:hypothetical protein
MRWGRERDEREKERMEGRKRWGRERKGTQKERMDILQFVN